MTRVKLMLPKPMDSYQACLTHAQQEFCKKFGGFTSYSPPSDDVVDSPSSRCEHGMDVTGGWQNPDGEVETEPVTVLEGYTELSEPNVVIFMDSVAEYIMGRNGYDESAIMFVVNNDQYLVESSDGERLKVTA